MEKSQWSDYEKLVLFRLRQNHAATQEIRETLARIDSRIVRIETRDKFRAGIVSALVSGLILFIEKLF